MSDWHVGQLVVSIGDWGRVARNHPKAVFPIQGCIYTIRSIEHCRNGSDLLFFLLEEIVNPKGFSYEPSFAARGFRPLRKTSIEVFTAMLNKTPEMEDA